MPSGVYTQYLQMGMTMGLSKILARETSASCRVALQIALQLPENVEEARRALDEAGYLLENFMVPAPREVRRRHFQPAEPLSLARTALIAVAIAVVLAPLGAVLAVLTGLEAASVWTLLVGVSWTSLVLGRVGGLLFSVLGSAAHNLLVIPPAFSFNVPMPADILRLIGFVTIALLLPMIAASAHDLRRAVSGGSSLSAVAAAMRSQD
jgi:K+-sensing histidine kinase KdpD